MPHQKRTFAGFVGGLLGLVGLGAVTGLLITATVTPAIAITGYATSTAIDSFDNMPGYLKIDPLMLPTNIYATDSSGKPQLLAEFWDQNRIPVTWNQVAPVMNDAILSAEDKNFYDHGGIDLVGTIKAFIRNSSSSTTAGGSSITQQYVKNIEQQNCQNEYTDQKKVMKCYAETTTNQGAAGYQRKLQELRYAIQLEKRYSKNEILLGYLNITSFGGNVYGIGAAAQRYFDTDAAHLTLVQAATLAGMVNAPSIYRIDMPGGTYPTKDKKWHNGTADGYADTKARRNYVLDRMLIDGRITKAQHDDAVKAPVVPQITDRQQGCSTAGSAAYFCTYVRNTIQQDPAFGKTADDRTAALRRGGLNVYTTLDPDLQAAAAQTMTIVPQSVPYLKLGSAGVQVQVGTGRVLSMVQNTPFSEGASVNGSTSVNYSVPEKYGSSIGEPAGSTYKLFSLINWLQHGRSIYETLDGRTGVKNVITCDGQTRQILTGTGAGGVANYLNEPGYVGTPYRFTADSLNSGFFTMATKISVCDTNKAAGQMGVTRGDGSALDQQDPGSDNAPNQPYDVLGSQPVAPVEMAEAFAAVAANGTLCQPKIIDKVTDSTGKELPIPKTTCKQALAPNIAATLAFVLKGPLTSTATDAVIGDGVPLIGKTGIHNYSQTWMDGSTTKVTTVVWVGNSDGADTYLNHNSANGYLLVNLRYPLFRGMQGAANKKYGGDQFPAPDPTLMKQSSSSLPSVVGMSIADATTKLQTAGFTVTVGDPVDAPSPAGTVGTTDPSAGTVASGTTVTLHPSTGNGATVPDVSGSTLDQAAQTLRGAGFTQLTRACSPDPSAPAAGQVTSTSPIAGTTTAKTTSISIAYQAPQC